MLKVSLAAVDRDEVRVREQIPADDPMWADAAIRLTRPLDVDLTARSVGEGVYVRGGLRTSVQVACRRCLTQVEREIDDTVDLLFQPLMDDEEEGADGEVYPLPARGQELDLREAVREQLLLRLPDFVVCTEACRGICPQCGQDLNAATCDCVPEKAESPWDVLKNVKFD
jgi:uncharacterized protein